MSPEPSIALRVVSDDYLLRAGVEAAFADEDAVVSGEPYGIDELDGPLDADVLILDLGDDVDGEAELSTIPTIALVDDLPAAQAAVARGASGVVSRQGEPDRIRAAVRAVLAGLRVVDQDFDELFGSSAWRPPQMPMAELTARESEVLELMSRGLSNPEIAEELGVTRHTAKFHVKAILDKLGAQTRTEAVVLAARNGLLHL